MLELRCVNDADLRAFLLGQMSARLSATVAAHLDACPDCNRRANELDDSADALVDSLRKMMRSAASTVTPCASDPAQVDSVSAQTERSPAYRILDEVGRGGMAVVYRARQSNPERIVALKVLLAANHGSAERRVRFRAEADTIGRLRHPNIVQVFDAGELDGLPFLALEYCDGGNLAQRMGGVPQPPLGAAALVEPLAQALQHAHQAGIIHRDLKPANVLLTGDGQPKVSDFGLAKGAQSELTATGAVLGTPHYMAPEQGAGSRQVGPAADVYALGAILYELLTGRLPFQGATALETLEQARTQEPVPPRRLQPKVPRDLETICLKCLEKDPHRRYADAGALANDLVRFREGRPVHARPVGVLGRGVRWARRNPAWAATALGIAALLTVFAVVQSVTILNLNAALQESEDERVRTIAAELAGKHQLWKAYLAQAQARRFSGRPGQRFESLDAIRKALALPTPPDHSLAELRNQAIACLVLADVQPALDLPTIPQPAGEDCLSPDVAHGRFATVGKDRALHLRHWPDGREIMRLENSGSLDAPSIVFSPDGRFLVHGSGWPTRAKLWRLDGPKPAVMLEHECRDSDLLPVFRTDSRQFAIGSKDGNIYLYATGTKDTLDRRLQAGFIAHRLAYCPNQRRLAAACNDSPTITILDIDSGHRVTEFRHPDNVTALAWDPTGRVLASACDNALIYFWDSARGQLLRPPLEGHTAHICDIGFNHTGDRFASLDWDYTLRLWDVQAGRILVTTTCNRLTPLGPDDEYLLGDTVQERAPLLRIANARELRTQIVSNHSRQRFFSRAIASPDGRFLAAAAGIDTILIDWEHGIEIAEIPSTHPFTFTRDGAMLTHRLGRPIERWPLQTDPASGIVHVGPPTTVYPTSSKDVHGSSSDGTVVAIPAQSHALVVHAAGAQKILKPCYDVRYCAVSPDGRWVATGNHFSDSGFGAAVWDAHSGERLQRLPVGHTCRVCFSPDGHWLLTTGGGYRLWHTETWQEGPRITQQSGENASVRRYAFTSDSKVVALSAGIGRIRLVEVATGRELAVLSVPESTHLQPMAFAPDNARLAAIGTGNRVLYTWDVRAIRAGLRDLHLDWDAPGYPPPPALAPPLRVQVHSRR